ncbi:hypothetical protein DSO57_1011379 [Entomophthora muscae]|uniref:Uncharacterized protein n=1 Tax=Entomophthora muscae TaxID=34485 RepID=A0ACC2THI0_9FUNG|nr:hypothetical protein DSO57_1011379 [Entomophthora muscae]
MGSVGLLRACQGYRSNFDPPAYYWSHLSPPDFAVQRYAMVNSTIHNDYSTGYTVELWVACHYSASAREPAEIRSLGISLNTDKVIGWQNNCEGITQLQRQLRLGYQAKYAFKLHHN